MRTLEEAAEFHNMPPNPLPSILYIRYMRIRPDKYYSVICERKNHKERVDIEDGNPDEVIKLVLDTFRGKVKPGMDANGDIKTNIPFTRISIIQIDKSGGSRERLIQRRIYNLAPIQVRERIINSLKDNN